jgi:hypothetical protein
MTPSQTRTRSLIFRRCALVQNSQSRMRTTVFRSTKTLNPKTKRQRIHLAAALYSYYSTLNKDGDEIDWDRMSEEEFET